MVAQLNTSANRQAALAIALAEDIPLAERRQLLDMLGLIADDGTIADDDERFNFVSNINGGGADGGNDPMAAGRKLGKGAFAAMYDDPDRPELLTSPPLLRTYAKRMAEIEKAQGVERGPMFGPRRPAADRKVIPCGTTQGRHRHMRHHEQVCDPCRDAYNADRRQYRIDHPRASTRRPDVEVPRGARCGSMVGRKDHKRNGEPVCRECKDYYNAWQRGRWAAKRAGKPSIRTRSHGTIGGRKLHKAEGTPMCQPCKDVCRAAGRKYWATRVAKLKAATEAEQLQQAS